MLEKQNNQIDDLLQCTPTQLRELMRNGRYQGQTAGLAPGQLQGNVAILPQAFAFDFFRFCHLNQKACPLIGVTEVGNPILEGLGHNIDIRTDVSRYNIYTDGKLSEQVSDISSYWSEDFVAFVLGCSFSFEDALIQHGIPLKHILARQTVAMYRSNIPTVAAGPFDGNYVVSMRPLSGRNAALASAITKEFPLGHGMPIHIGAPSLIGIDSIENPDWGDPIEIAADEIPVFWACGVTTQVAIENAKPPLCITHAPGHMLITDLQSSSII